MYERHFFVCQNRREGTRASCGNSGSEELTRVLKECLRDHGELRGKIRITTTGCLGQCEAGPTIVVYPENTWYLGVTQADVKEICESHLVQGKPVERLKVQLDE